MNSIHRLFSLFVVGASVTPSVAQEYRQVPLQSQVTRVQPMTGIALWTDSDKAATDAISLEYRYCGYNEIVNADGQYNYAKLDKILDQVAARGHQAVLRFYFVYVGKQTTVPDSIRLQPEYKESTGTSEGQKTHFCDWRNKALQEFVLEFYTRFAKRYDKDPRVAFLQTGFGLWAEYHIYEGPRRMGKTFPSKSFQTRFLKHLAGTFKNLPWSVSVDAADYDYSPLEDNDKLLALKFGVFDDSFLCKQHAKENAVNWKVLGSDRWQTAPAGGEFSYYTKHDQKQALSDSGPHGIPFSKSARQFHLSYIVGNDQPRYRSMETISSAGMATGYRFRITSARHNGSTLQLQVTNTGVAPIYRDAWFTAGTTRAKRSLKGLLPGDTLKCDIPNVNAADIKRIRVESDSILPSQTIQFEASLP